MANAIQDRGARDIAKRALETVGQVFRDSVAHGYSKRSPSSEIRPSDILKSIPKTNYARVDAKELPTPIRCIEVYPGKQVTRLAIKLMALTFVRTSELIGAKWTEIDMDAGRWDISPECGKRRLQPRTLSGATRQDDAGLGGFSGTNLRGGKVLPFSGTAA